MTQIPVEPNRSPTNTPVAKVTAAGAAGAIATIVVAIGQAMGLDVPAEAAAGLTALLAFAAGYVTPPRGNR